MALDIRFNVSIHSSCDMLFTIRIIWDHATSIYNHIKNNFEKKLDMCSHLHIYQIIFWICPRFFSAAFKIHFVGSVMCYLINVTAAYFSAWDTPETYRSARFGCHSACKARSKLLPSPSLDRAFWFTSVSNTFIFLINCHTDNYTQRISQSLLVYYVTLLATFCNHNLLS